jgi:phosphoesterase RecJ-like protein
LLTAHEGPDGDAIGSTLGLAHLLYARGKDVGIFFGTPLEAKYARLVGDLTVLGASPDNGTETTLVALDAADWDRVPVQAERFGRRIWIDHHPRSNPDSDFILIDPAASSTGEILASLFLDEFQLPQLACECWYFAILADTNGFQQPNTTARTLALASILVERGAQPSRAAELFFNQMTLRDLRLFALAMSNVTISGELAWALLPLSSGVGEDFDSDFILNLWRRWPQPRVYALFKETAVGHYKISLRSNGSVDVASVARQFHGGGHRAASGCQFEGTFEEARDALLRVLQKETARD